MGRACGRILIALTWLCVPSAPAQNMNIQTYDVDDGLPQSQVMSIHRDPGGYLWVGTYSGAARYNGRIWTRYGRKEGLPGNHVTAFLTDSDGVLWVGTFGQGLARFNDTAFEGFPPETPWGSCVVYKLAQDARHRIWAATDQGLFIIQDGRFQQLTDQDGLPHRICYDVFTAKSGIVYVGTQSGPAAVVDDAVQRLPFGETFADKSVFVVMEDQDRRLWLGTARGLYCVEGTHVRRIEHPVLRESAITAATLEHESGIWFGTRRFGVFKLQGTQVRQELSTDNGLANTWAHALYYDEEDNLWVGTDSGLSKYRPGNFVAVTRRHGLTNTIARTLYLDDKNILWIGTRDGVFQMTPDFHVTRYDTSRYAGHEFYSIARKADGTMVMVTTSHLILDKDGAVTNYGPEAGVTTTAFRACLVDSRDRVWVGGDGLHLLEGDHFRRMPDDHELYKVRIYNLIEDAKGVIWAATSNGLVGYHPENGSTIVPEGPRVSTWDLDADDRGGIWIGTNGHGLWYYDGTHMTRYTSTDSDLANDFVWFVLAAADGHVWAGHNLGIDRWDGTRFRHFTKSDGLVENEGAATAVVEGRDGRIYFGAGEGVSVYIAGESDRDIPPPRVLVEAVEVADRDGKTRRPAADEALAHDENNLTFRYAGLSFIKEEKVDFSYRLEGLDARWNPPTPLTEVRYMNLAPGAYAFRIKARNDNGAWSKDTTFPFAVQPALYQTRWFQIACLVLGITVVLFYIRARLTLVQRRNRELEILVQQRTEALAQKGREFRELSLSDPLTLVRNRRYVSETMREEMSRLKRRYFRYRKGDPYTCLGVVLLDLDYFKSVNDRYGHDAGDQILLETAGRLKAAVRESDVVARWGGEEFLILYREVHPDDLPEMVVKLLAAVRDTPFDIGNGRELVRTTSAGFAYLHPTLVQRDMPWEWALKMADVALFKAKEAGRDRAIGIVLNEDAVDETWYRTTLTSPEESLAGEALEVISLA